MANHIGVFLIQKTLDDMRTSIMHKRLTGWLDQSIKEGAKLIFNELGDILPMIFDIIFHDSGQDRAKGAGIVKAILVPQLEEVGVGAFLLYAVQTLINFLVDLHPIRMAEQADYFLHHGLAISVFWWRGDLWMDNIEFLIESLRLDQHLHEDGVNLAGFSGFVEGLDGGDVLFEVMQDMGAHRQCKQAEKHDLHHFQQIYYRLTSNDQRIQSNLNFNQKQRNKY